uniref:Uncharacterized protein n=1 Tax=Tetranychus urticae TaxID=32264 RepID=T1K6Q4_TETUR
MSPYNCTGSETSSTFLFGLDTFCDFSEHCEVFADHQPTNKEHEINEKFQETLEMGIIECAFL